MVFDKVVWCPTNAQINMKGLPCCDQATQVRVLGLKILDREKFKKISM